MKYCPISTTFRNPASIQNLLNLYCCDNFSIRSPYCCNRRSWFVGSSQSKETCLDRTEHNRLSHHHIRSNWSIVKGFIFFTHFRDCSVKTELICRTNYAKNSLNRFLVGCKVYRQFTMSFAVELTSGQWSRRTENWTSALSEFQQHPFYNFVPNSLWTVLFDWVPLLFRTKTNEWPLSFSKPPCIQR